MTFEEFLDSDIIMQYGDMVWTMKGRDFRGDDIMIKGDSSGKMGRDMEHNYEWKKKNIRRYALTLNRTNEKDVIDHLEAKPNKRQYLIELIRGDIKKKKGN